MRARARVCVCVCVYAERDHNEIAQAFSHYSWVMSSRNLLVCDIQGVGLTWTDPQVMCVDLRGVLAHYVTMPQHIMPASEHSITSLHVARHKHTHTHTHTHTCEVFDVQVNSGQRAFGSGDLGQEGIKAFFSTHRCNKYCRHLGITGEWPKK